MHCAKLPNPGLAITIGVDVQRDRLETVVIGWTEGNHMLVLGHRVVWGAWNADETWAEPDGLVTERFAHEPGGRIGLDAVVIDAGDGTSMHRVTDFCRQRARRKVTVIKGASGNRPVIEKARSKTKTGAQL